MIRVETGIFFAVALTLTGCASLGGVKDLDNRVSTLEDRVNAVESRAYAKEARAPQAIETVTYVTPVEIEVKKPAKRTVSRTGTITMTTKEIQTALRNAGYYNGPIDGVLGNRSREAVRKFQSDNGLKVDGLVGTQTKGLLIDHLSK
jgi:murein L,D-transpeptidase YcbB/YkuD